MKLGKALVTGAKGILGAALARRLGPAAVGVDVDDFDVTDEAAVAAFVAGAAPAVIINCAAYTDVDACEDDYDRALAVNGQAVGIIAAAAKRAGARLVHISTDFIFDGEAREPYAEDAMPNPISKYGLSKLEGEKALAASGADYILVRTSWLFGVGRKNFVETVISLAEKKGELSIVNNEVASPTYADDLAGGILALLEKGASGVYHCTNSGAASRYDWAKKILELGGWKARLNRVSSFRRKAKVPKYSVLSNAKFAKEVGKPLPDWRDALKRYIEERKCRDRSS